MKKILKRIVAVSMVLSIAINGESVVCAKDNDDKQLLYEAGFDKIVLSEMDEKVASEIAKKIRKCPNDVQVSSDIVTYDMLDELELAVNLSQEELVEECNVSKKEAKEIKQNIDEMRKMSDKELSEEYNLSNADMLVLKDALTVDEDFESQKESDMMLASTIGSSKLTFTQTVINNSTKKMPIYDVNLYFSWKKAYWPLQMGFSDKIACAWGGKLVYNTAKPLWRKGTYCDMYGFGTYSWGNNFRDKTLSCNTAQKNMTFVAPQEESFNMYPNFLRSGYMSFTIDNVQFKNNKVNVCSVYCHRKLAVASANIGFKGSTISVGGAYDTTDMANTTITILQ